MTQDWASIECQICEAEITAITWLPAWINRQRGEFWWKKHQKSCPMLSNLTTT